MRLLLALGCSLIILSACQKQKYKPYLGTYQCEVHLFDDSLGYITDTTYTEIAELTEKDSRHMQFRDLPVPYKYIDDKGYYESSTWVVGAVWGRQITLKDDSLLYYHYEHDEDRFWTIKYFGKKI